MASFYVIWHYLGTCSWGRGEKYWSIGFRLLGFRGLEVLGVRVGLNREYHMKQNMEAEVETAMEAETGTASELLECFDSRAH